MATDTIFFGTGDGGSAETGIVGWGPPGTPGSALFPVPLQIGVWGAGSQHGVFGVIDDGTFSPGLSVILTGSTNYASSSGILGAAPQVTGVAGLSSSSVGVFGQAGVVAATLSPGLSCGVLGTATGKAGVMGFSDADSGVSGTSDSGAGVSGTTNTGPGVSGTSKKSFGVVGQIGTPVPLAFPPPKKAGEAAGVFGTGGSVQIGDAPVFMIGVAGTSARRIGVLGQIGTKPPVFDNAMTYTAGVVGTSGEAPAVIGFSAGTTGVIGVSGTAGPGVSTAPAEKMLANPMLTQRAGVIGSSSVDPKTPTAGVIGTSHIIGVYGFCPSPNGAAISGHATDPTGFAGYFRGRVNIAGGDFTVIGGVKNCAVPFPDGTYRVLHCMESPEVWFEDFGTAKLKRGRVTVKLDADFAKVIKLGDYHVFLTPQGDCLGLCARLRGGASFEVRELQGGTSSVAFSYRIVGRRKDITAHRRFAKIDIKVPMLPAPRTGRRQSSVEALFAKVRKQAGARPGRARRRRMAPSPQPLPKLFAKLRKQAGVKSARRRTRAKKGA